MTKKECISLFNDINNKNNISIDKAITLISDYLTEIKYENSDKIINLIIQNPRLIPNTFPTIMDYYCRKYYIFSLEKIEPDLLFNKYIKIMYYE